MEYNPERVPYSRQPPDPDADPLEVLTRRRADVKARKYRAKFYLICLVLLAFVAPRLLAEGLERTFGEQACVYIYRACVILSIVSALLFWHNIKGVYDQPQLLDFRLTRAQRKLLGLNPDAKVKRDAQDCRPKWRESQFELCTAEPPTKEKNPKISEFLSSLPPHDYSFSTESSLESSPGRSPEKLLNRSGGNVAGFSSVPTWKPEAYNFAKKPNTRFEILWKQYCKSASTETLEAADELPEVLDQQFQLSGGGWENLPEGMVRFLPLHEYRVAPVPCDDKKDILHDVATVGGLPVLSEWQLLEKENIEREDLFEWSERVREWLADYLFKPIARMIEQIDEELRLNALEHLDTVRCANTPQSSLRNAFQVIIDARKAQPNEGYVAPTPDKMASFFRSTITIGGPPATLEDLAKRFPKWVVVVDRLRLEAYLNVPGYDGARDYVIQRIKTLASSHRLQHYKHDGGSSDWAYKKHPSDPEIVCHIFCALLDMNMPMANPGDLPFTRNYFVPTEGEAHPEKGVQIKQTRKAKHGGVHYMIIAKRVCYDLRPGMYNLFLTIAFFVWYINKYYNGYIGALNMNGKTVNMKGIFERRVLRSNNKKPTYPHLGGRRFSLYLPGYDALVREPLQKNGS